MDIKRIAFVFIAVAFGIELVRSFTGSDDTVPESAQIDVEKGGSQDHNVESFHRDDMNTEYMRNRLYISYCTS